jgi:hypothetical protein
MYNENGDMTKLLAPFSRTQYYSIQETSEQSEVKLLNKHKNITYVAIVIASILVAAYGDAHVFATSDSGTNPIIVWNNLANQITLGEKLPPPEIARVMALLDASIYNSLLTSQEQQGNNVLSERSIVAGAAYEVLVELFPSYIDKISSLKDGEINRQTKDHGNKIINLGFDLVKGVSNEVMDGMDNDLLGYGPTVFEKNAPVVDCKWNGTKPVLPNAGNWKTFILQSGSEIQPKAPFECGSKEDLEDLHETIESTKNLSTKQIDAIHYWGDKPPPTVWNEISNSYMQKYNMSTFDSAYLGAYLNVGMHDAFVSCWYSKYDYGTTRPNERIPNLATEIPTPNFPSYTSGHSVVSTTASRILGEVFPQERSHFDSMSTEASLSRLWAGIHFKQDVTNGIEQGSQIAEKILVDMHMPPHKLVP